MNGLGTNRSAETYALSTKEGREPTSGQTLGQEAER
jgi:hypothetical protein